MQDSSGSPAKRGSGDTPEEGRSSDPRRDAPTPEPHSSGATPSKPPDARFAAHAMKALFEASDVSIRRGDETRVMSRAQEALAEIQRRTSAPPPPPTPSMDSDARALGGSLSSRPPAPRVDVVLWIVLAVGIFAIAGWMILYAL